MTELLEEIRTTNCMSTKMCDLVKRLQIELNKQIKTEKYENLH